VDFTKNSYLFAVNEACQAMASAWCLSASDPDNGVPSLPDADEDLAPRSFHIVEGPHRGSLDGSDALWTC